MGGLIIEIVARVGKAEDFFDKPPAVITDAEEDRAGMVGQVSDCLAPNPDTDLNVFDGAFRRASLRRNRARRLAGTTKVFTLADSPLFPAYGRWSAKPR